ncbi:LacI family DNA-binding transcriptional regulator [Promicromonospora iranensis]|uniref:LacI family transcriptional regulator n=1 Tax=Promicromonospora iranensis TaxID=1105144 RepID=A0ABU2CK90_9MICO|nr:LacI family DNA-binding transcriptional regulator [Promicromonospora iranensis]MDR7381757.1 LacI family transcriptional regulator [Promicromonospora iranensis]
MAEPGNEERAKEPRTVPTISDVARHAGVSPMTVSRVLSGGQHVSATMRRKVETSVRALGYRRNENARSLRPGHRSGLVGVVVTNLANPYYAEVLEGIGEILSEANRRVVFGTSHEDPEEEARLIADFVGRQTEGLIVVPAGGPSEHLRPEQRHGVPLVFASRRQDGVDVDAVIVDDVRGAERVTALLLEEGHRRIAFVGNAVSVFTGQRRYEGFERAHAAAGVPVLPELVRRGQQDIHSAETAARELLALDEPPTAIFGANNRNMVGAIKALHAASAARGTDLFARVRLASFDTFDLEELVPGDLSVVTHDARELGRTAAELLLVRLQGKRPDRPTRTIELPTSIRTRRRSEERLPGTEPAQEPAQAASP